MLVRSAKLIYRGSDCDFKPKSFYNRCNGTTNCLTILKTTQNKIVGGYTPIPIVYHDEEELKEEKDLFESDATGRSFIFSITNLKSFSIKNSKKAICYKKNSAGPCFGPDLDINKTVSSSIGNSYETSPGISVDSLESKVFLL